LIHKIATISRKKTFDVVVVSDYAKGTITEAVMDMIRVSFKCPIVCDIKPANKYMFTGVFGVVPNLAEAIEMAPNNDSTIEGLAKAIKDDLGLRVVMITLSQNGLFLLDENDESHSFKAHIVVYKNDPSGTPDVTGAGDTVLSTFASCIVSGYTTEESALLGNIAAGVVVRKPGTAVCSAEELKNAYLRM
jgi:rfaE bifunctional protein kinase chain/domain